MIRPDLRGGKDMALKLNPFLKNLLGRLPLVRRLADDDKGVTLVYVALSLPVILGFAGLGVDIAVWNLDKRESQAMADAAAMAAGISVMRTGNFATITSTATTGASDNGFSAGNGDVITVNSPPSVGPRSAAVWGDPDGDGTFGDTDAIEVFIRRPAPALFSSIIMATNSFVQSRTVINAINEPGENCMISLDPDGGITLNGGATVNLDCGALSNGDVTLNGGSCLTASQVLVVGSGDDNACSTDPVPSITRPDPLRFMPEVNERACDRNPPLNVTNGNTFEQYARPDGIYVFCGDVAVHPGGTLNLHPGIYVFHGVNLSVQGTLNTIGGAMIYMSEDANNANSINIAGGAFVDFDPLAPGVMDGNVCNSGSDNPMVGPTLVTCSLPADIDPTDPDPAAGTDLDDIYEGIAIFGDRDVDDGVNYNFSGGATMSINGVIYLPGGDVSWSGGSSADVKAILADSVTVSGNSDFGTIEGTILESLLAYTFIKIIE